MMEHYFDPKEDFKNYLNEVKRDAFNEGFVGAFVKSFTEERAKILNREINELDRFVAKIRAYKSLLSKDRITIKDAAAKLNMTTEELEELIN